MESVVELDTTELLTKVDPRYLSVALGMLHKNWKQLDFSNQRVINMARALSPAYVRLGGTGADLAIFDESLGNQIPQKSKIELKHTKYVTHGLQLNQINKGRDCEKLNLLNPRKNFTFSKEDWIGLNNFTKNVNWTLLFDVNAVLKRSDGCWSSSNFRKLLNFSSSLGYKSIAWELGIIYKLRLFIFSPFLTNEFLKQVFVLNFGPLYSSLLFNNMKLSNDYKK